MPWHILRATLGRGLGVSVGVGRGRWVSGGRVGCLGGRLARVRGACRKTCLPTIWAAQSVCVCVDFALRVEAWRPSHLTPTG
jgi:hypothetical protein